MISVIVPAFNAEKTIRNCIESVLSQEFEEETELIIVDDESTDSTKQIVKEYKEVLLLEQNHAGPAVARNLGAKKARGEIILFTDSDCEAAENWIREMVSPFIDENVVGVQGAYRTRQNSLAARFSQIEIEERYEKMAAAKKLDWIGSYSAAYRKRVFLDFGGFDESFPIASGEDPELSFRMAEKGLLLVFNPKAIVFHLHPESWKKYFRSKYFRAYWRILLYKKHPQKAVNDSYTTIGLKVQIAGIILFCAGLLLWLFGVKSELFLAFSALLFVAGILKFVFFALGRDVAVAIVSPIALFSRSVIFFCGLLKGFVDGVAK